MFAVIPFVEFLFDRRIDLYGNEDQTAAREGLEVDTQRMHEVLDMTNGVVVSEAFMMGLGPYLGGEYAHDLVYDICREAIRQERRLLDLLTENNEISKHLNHAEIAKAVRSRELSRPIGCDGRPCARERARKVIAASRRRVSAEE